MGLADWVYRVSGLKDPDELVPIHGRDSSGAIVQTKYVPRREEAYQKEKLQEEVSAIAMAEKKADGAKFREALAKAKAQQAGVGTVAGGNPMAYSTGAVTYKASYSNVWYGYTPGQTTTVTAGPGETLTIDPHMVRPLMLTREGEISERQALPHIFAMSGASNIAGSTVEIERDVAVDGYRVGVEVEHEGQKVRVYLDNVDLIKAAQDIAKKHVQPRTVDAIEEAMEVPE